jgi:hypothetical protein
MSLVSGCPRELDAVLFPLWAKSFFTLLHAVGRLLGSVFFGDFSALGPELIRKPEP